MHYDANPKCCRAGSEMGAVGMWSCGRRYWALGKIKQEVYGFKYHMLKRTRRLSRSMTLPYLFEVHGDVRPKVKTFGLRKCQV